ncbi:MAG: small basic protein [Candidatus Omnitrophota bacterium]
MSQHRSLRSKAKETVYRSVLKRYERLKKLAEKEEWDETESVYGLPKLKIIKFKIKKEKSAEALAAAEGAEGAVAGTEAQAAAPGQAQAKAPKGQDKAPAKEKGK